MNNTNNIVNTILNVMTNGQNPQQLIAQILQQNPQANVMFNQMKQSGMSMKDFTIQYAKQNNINLQPILNMLSQKGVNL